MSEVKNKLDLLQRLGPDMSIKVLTHLDPCDLVRVSTLSRSWHQFGKPFEFMVCEICSFSNVILSCKVYFFVIHYWY